MKKSTILIFLIISTIISVIFILLNYFGINRLLMLHIYGSKSYRENYSKLPKVSDEKQVKIFVSANKNTINRMEPTITSILDQTNRVDKIYLVLSDKNLTVPDFVSKVCNIVHSICDGESINCVVSKQKDSDVELIMIRPDVVYGKDFVEKIVEEGEKTNDNLEGQYSKLIKIKNCSGENLLGNFQKFSYSENFKRL